MMFQLGMIEYSFLTLEHFFGKGLIIRDLATNRVLAPLTDYRVLYLVREAVIASNKEVYAVIMITDPGVLDIKLQYQAIGWRLSKYCI